MINQLNNFQIWTKTVITAVMGVTSGYYIKALSAEYETSIMIVAIIILIVLISKIVELFIHFLVNKSIFIRKALLGSHFIEGYWLERVADISKNEGLQFFAILKISFVNNTYVVSGETFNHFGEILATFHSQFSNYSNYLLSYSFEGLNTSNIGTRIIGNGELRFTPSSGYPKRFIGSIYSSITGLPIRVIADKIAPELLNKIDDPESRIELFKPYIETKEKSNILVEKD